MTPSPSALLADLAAAFEVHCTTYAVPPASGEWRVNEAIGILCYTRRARDRLLSGRGLDKPTSAHHALARATSERALWALARRTAKALSTIPLFQHPHFTFRLTLKPRAATGVLAEVDIDSLILGGYGIALPRLCHSAATRLARLERVAAPGPFLPFSMHGHITWAPTADLALAKWAILIGREDTATLDPSNSPDVALYVNQNAVRRSANRLLASLQT